MYLEKVLSRKEIKIDESNLSETSSVLAEIGKKGVLFENFHYVKKECKQVWKRVFKKWWD